MKAYLILISQFICLLKVAAEIKLPAILSDHMVLQQNDEVRLWGTAKSNSFVSIETSWDAKTYRVPSDAKGNFEVFVRTIAGSWNEYEIRISDGQTKTLRHVLLGEVWVVGGQSNMEMSPRGFTNQPLMNAADEILDSNYPSIRLFSVRRQYSLTPQDDCSGEWRPSNALVVERFSSIGINFAKILQKQLDVPIGIIGSYWGGSKIEAWMSREVLNALEKGKTNLPSLDEKTANQTASVLFNAMIHPIRKFRIKGCLFYQGEANITDPQSYEILFPEMVKVWRNAWKQDFPFYYVQLAPFPYTNMGYGAGGTEVARFREVQYRAWNKIPNAGMVGTADVGAENTIHPPDKRTVAKRLAYYALVKTYGIAGFDCNPPVLQSVEWLETKAVVRFDHAGYGLSGYGDELRGFELAGEDQVFYPAKAKILYGKKTDVEVWHEKVNKPVAVRYCFKNYAPGNLYSSFGIAAIPFRTDNWDIP